MNMAKMPGRLARPWCPVCKAEAGLDCPDNSPTRRKVRRSLQRQLRREALQAVTERGAAS